MDRHPLLAHLLVLIASLAGIVGMSLVFQGVMDGDPAQLGRGAPLLLAGLWWSGRQLARSMQANRMRRRIINAP